jgi:hypothetical protein
VTASRRFLVTICVAIAAAGACGKKGPPLPPLRLVPAPVSEVGVRRTGMEVELKFALPKTNLNGPGAVDMDRVEIYAVTIGPGAPPPANRDLLTKARIVGAIAVQPPPEEGEPPAASGEADKRPAPGDRVTFVEELTAEKLKPVPMPAPPAGRGSAVDGSGAAATAKPAPDTPAPGTLPPGTPAPASTAANPPAPGTPAPVTPAPGTLAPATQHPVPALPTKAGEGPASPEPRAPNPVTYAVRIYSIRGISRGGRPGPPAARVVVPLVDPVPPPTSLGTRVTERSVVVTWTPPVAEPGGPPVTFNVYRKDAAASPLNQAPIAGIEHEHSGIEFGKEQCFVVRSLQAIQNVSIESDASEPTCVTPQDKFPPAEPKGLRAVAEAGAVSLVWDANSEADLAGYLVLRAEAPGETLQPLTPKPVREANYRDTTVKPGVRYVYAVVAVDTATPANTSAQSAREEVTAR